MTDKYDRILEGIGELRGLTSSMASNIEGIRSDVDQNTRDLTEHIAGVRTQADRLTNEIEYRDKILKTQEETINKKHLDLDTRLKEVEFLPNLVKSSWHVLKWVGAAAGAIVAITKLMRLW